MAYIGKNPRLKSIVSQGDTLANLTAEPRVAGRLVYATDTEEFYKDDGTTLTVLAGSALALLAKGSLLSSDGIANTELPVGTNGQVLTADSAETLGVKWATPAGGGGSAPVGTILPFAGVIANIPAGYLLCDGSQIDRTTYSALFTAIGTNWGSGNGTTTFHLPDARGQFLRGMANGSANDPDRASRTASNAGGSTGDQVGSAQTSQYASHGHALNIRLSNGNSTMSAGLNFGQSDSAGNSMATNAATNATSGNYIGAAGGNETRPRNVYVNYIIKY